MVLSNEFYPLNHENVVVELLCYFELCYLLIRLSGSYNIQRIYQDSDIIFYYCNFSIDLNGISYS